MKKLLLIGFAFVFGLVLVACDEVTTAAPTTAQPTTQAPTTAAPTTVAPTTVAPTTVAPTTTQEPVELAELYSGTHTVTSGMAAGTVYNYHMSFIEGEYEFYCEFEMMGENYDFYEFGVYTLVDSVLTITPDEGEALAGVFNVDASIEVSIKPSEMAIRAVQTLTPFEGDLELNEFYRGSHTVTSGMAAGTVYVYQMMFDDGEFEFGSNFVMMGELYQYVEAGTYSVVGNVLTITKGEDAPIVGTIHVNGDINIVITPSSMSTPAEHELLPIDNLDLADSFSGTHTVTEGMAAGTVYEYTITFTDGNYAFRSDYEMMATPYFYEEAGTYEFEGNVLTLTPTGGVAVTGTIQVNGNIEAPIKPSTQGERALRMMSPVVEEEPVE